MKNCIIIEDQLPAQRILKIYIEDIGTLNLMATFSDAIQAIDFIKDHKVELIFLDIHLPKLSGIDFLKTLVDPPKIILTTAFPNYALESYEFDVVDYLLKPFSFQRFIKAVSKVNDKDAYTNKSEIKSDRASDEIFLKSGHEHIKINIGDIVYIKSDSDYTDVHLKNKKHISSKPLIYWVDRLNEFKFMRVHKSYIINLDKIEKISGSQIYLTINIPIPIGRTYKKIVSERFLK